MRSVRQGAPSDQRHGAAPRRPQKVRWGSLAFAGAACSSRVSPEFVAGEEGMRAGSGERRARRDRPDAAARDQDRYGNSDANGQRECWPVPQRRPAGTAAALDRGWAAIASSRSAHVRWQLGKVRAADTAHGAARRVCGVRRARRFRRIRPRCAGVRRGERDPRIRAVTRRGLRDRADRRRVGQQRCCSARRPVAGVPGGPAPRRSGARRPQDHHLEIDARKFASLRSGVRGWAEAGAMFRPGRRREDIAAAPDRAADAGRPAPARGPS